MAAGSEHRVDLIVGPEKSLRLPDRFEPSHEFLSFPGWPVRSFDQIVKPLMRPMIGVGQEAPDRLDIAAQFVRHDDARLVKAGNQPTEKALGCLGAAS